MIDHNFECETMRICRQKTARQRVLEYQQVMMPVTVLGDNGTCPDHLVVMVTQKDMPMLQSTLHRKQGESGSAFYDRAIHEASWMTAKVRGEKQLSLYKRDYYIQIICDYGNNTDTAWHDGRANFLRVLHAIIDDPRHGDAYRVYCAGILENYYNSTPHGSVH